MNNNQYICIQQLIDDIDQWNQGDLSCMEEIGELILDMECIKARAQTIEQLKQICQKELAHLAKNP